MTSSFKTFIVLLALLLPTLLLNLGDRPTSKIQEVRIAETAREMLASGDFLVPRYNGELRLQKPPLPYWATAASYGLGGINETMLRLPAALFGLLSVLLLFGWCCRTASLQVAAVTALVFATSFIGIRYFRSGEADAMLLFFIIAACLTGYNMLFGKATPLRRLLFGLALGLGFATKGPAALAIPLLTLLATAWLGGRLCNLKSCFSLAGIVAVLLVGFGWYAWIWLHLPDAAKHFFGGQLDETFIAGTHSKSFWWYLPHLFDYFAPWGILLLPAAWWSFRTAKEADVLPLRFAWIWLGVVFVLLTLTVNKQTQYALLLAPPVALIVGSYLAGSEGTFSRINRAFFALCALGAVAAVVYAAKNSAPILPGDILRLGTLFLFPLALKLLLRTESPSWPILLIAAGTCCIYLYGEMHLSSDDRQNSAQILTASAPPQAAFFQLRPEDGAISFYARRVVPPIEPVDIPAMLRGHAEIWVIADKMPSADGVRATLIAEAGGHQLYRLSRQ